MKADFLVISPHPDDAEYAVAGSVARWVREGKQVVYVICTNGDKGTGDRDIKPEELARTREKEQLAAAEILGVQKVVFLRYPDQNLEDTPLFRKELVRQIRTFRPDTVITADPYRKYIWHRDHRITGRVVLDAVFPCARDHLAFPDLLEEGLQPHKVKEVLCWAAEDINCRLNISGTFDLKIKALRAHHSQVGHRPQEEFEKRLRRRYGELAAGEKFELAEAFHRVVLPG